MPSQISEAYFCYYYILFFFMQNFDVQSILDDITFDTSGIDILSDQTRTDLESLRDLGLDSLDFDSYRTEVMVILIFSQNIALSFHAFLSRHRVKY